MNIIASFTDNGVPKTELSPTINIREVPTGVLVISGSNMTELGDGSYYYDYANYDSEKDYSIRCDGGSCLAYTERYTFAGNENYINDIENVLDTNTTLSGIQEDLNNPDQYKADISELALETTVSGIKERTDRILTATEIKQCIITDASATPLAFTTNLTETGNQFWSRGVILITSGNNEGQMRAILNYNGSTKKITLKTPLDTVSAQNDTFIILTERKYLTADIEDIINAGWDEPIIDHTNTASFGGKNQKGVPSETVDDYKATGFALETTVSGIRERTDRIPDSPSPTQEYDAALSGIPSAVWNEFVTDHTVSGTFGELLSDIKIEVDAITIKLPEGDIAESGEYTTLLNNIEIYILRNLGLSQENYYLDQTVYISYQGAKLLTGGRIRVYSDAVSVGTDSNVIATYIITATWTDDKLQTYKVVKQ